MSRLAGALFARFLLALALVLAPLGAPALALDNLNRPKDVTAISATTTAAKLMPTAQAARIRRAVMIQPTNGTIYIGGPSVTSSTGLVVTSGMIISLEWSQGDAWYARTASGTVDVRVVPIEP